MNRWEAKREKKGKKGKKGKENNLGTNPNSSDYI
jgi:hypothetical protein